MPLKILFIGDVVGAPGRINHDEQLHDVVVGRVARGLDDENVGTTDVLVNFHKRLAIGEGRDGGLAERRAHRDLAGGQL